MADLTTSDGLQRRFKDMGDGTFAEVVAAAGAGEVDDTGAAITQLFWKAA